MSLRVWYRNVNVEDEYAQNSGLDDIVIDQHNIIHNNTDGKLSLCSAEIQGTSSSYITIPAEAMTDFTDACSVAFWFKIISWGTNAQTIFSCGNSTSSPYRFFTLYRIGNTSSCNFEIQDENEISVVGVSELELNQWYHIVMLYGSGHQKLYLNGNLVSQRNATVILPFSSINIIGIGYNCETNFLLNDFRIYDEVLPLFKIHQLAMGLSTRYNLGARVYRSSSQLFHIYMPNIGYAPEYLDLNESTASGSVMFSPTTYQIHLGSIAPMGTTADIKVGTRQYYPKDEITIAVWLSQTNWNNFVYPLDCTQYEDVFSITKSSSKIAVNFMFEGDSTMTTTLYSTALSEMSSGWHHIAITFDGYTVKLYLDGVLDNSSTTFSTRKYIKYSTENARKSQVYLGSKSSDTTTHFNGSIADYRIYSTALSPEDINKIIKVNKTIKFIKGDIIAAERFVESNSNNPIKLWKEEILCNQLKEDSKISLCKNKTIKAKQFIEL